LGNIRLSYIDADGNGIIATSEIVEENNYYPFGLKHKGYNGAVNGADYPYGFQDQEETNDPFGFNMIEFKYRMHDPAIGRFIQVDPLASKYPYNSTYAFSENRVIDGNELEGLEYERFAMGVSQIIGGLTNYMNNSIYGEASRQIRAANSLDGVKNEQIKHEGQINSLAAINEINKGGKETINGSLKIVGNILEKTGDGVTVLGIATAQPELYVIGEGMSFLGSSINGIVDLSDGKSPIAVGLKFGASVAIGQAGTEAIKATRKVAGQEFVDSGGNKITESIIQGTKKTYEKISDEVVMPSINIPYDDPDKK
jgi:RHS repeat-associated protein